MCIGIVLNSLGLVRGGTETRAVQMATRLHRRGHRVWLAGGWWPGRSLPQALLESGLEVIRLPAMPADWAPLRLLGRFSEFRAFRWQGRIFRFMARLSPWLKRRIGQADVTFTLQLRDTLWLSRRRRQLGRAHISYFTGGSPQMASLDQSHVKVANPRVLDAGHPSGQRDFDGVFPPGIPGSLLELPFEVRPQALCLLYVGRLEHNNGPLDLLDVFSLLWRDFPGLRLRYVGHGVQSRATRRKVKGKGLEERVVFKGVLDQQDVWKEMREADLLVMPLRHGHFPLTLLEASAVGLPVVTSDIPGVCNGCAPDSLKLPLDQSQIWSRALSQLIADQPARRRMSESGRRFAAAYTWEEIARNMERMFHLALSRASKPASRRL
ncbi:MAG TPA: glycosyltransferase family 4 protein [Acidobacteriota bacterium]|nr:glycosyltransferase family 4 protein [Acidobacteriota bacterium]